MKESLTMNKIYAQIAPSPLFAYEGFNPSANGYTSEYANNYKIIDEAYVAMYGELVLRYANAERQQQIIKAWGTYTRAFLYANDYKFKKLYESGKLEYDPLDNYREHERRTISGEKINTRTGSEKNEQKYGRTDTQSGKQKTETVHGLTQTQTGSVDHSMTGGETTTASGMIGNSVEKLVNPSDDREYVGSEKTVTTGGSGHEVNKLAYDNRKDTDTFNQLATANSGTDTTTVGYDGLMNTVGGKDESIKSYDSVTDTESYDDYVEEVTADGCSRGDTSQHLIELEREVADWSFWYQFFDTFNKMYTTGFYEEGDD